MTAGATSYDVRVWTVRRYVRKKGTTFGVRWSVNGERQHRTFRSVALADSFRSELLTATRRGESFDVTTGLPVSMQPVVAGPTWYDHACAFVDSMWPRLAPRSRQALADALATSTLALLAEPGRDSAPEDTRRLLYSWAFNAGRRKAGPPPTDLAAPLNWIERHPVPLAVLDDPRTVRRVLDALAVNLDGKPSAGTTVARRRAVLHSALRYGVELEHFASNPLDRVRWKAPRVADTVDRRSVVNHDQARALLAAVGAQEGTGPQLVAFFACMYYAAMRPAEINALRETDIAWPTTNGGWGELLLSRSDPTTSTAWTDDGIRKARQLKHRATSEVRAVPCAPPLVHLLRQHVDAFGTTPDGRLFRGARKGPFPESVYGDAWRTARSTALTAAEVASPLAARPYDLRHAAVSTWLNAGVAAPQVARWAGHSVDVLLRVYAKCIVGQEDAARQRIETALGGAENRFTYVPQRPVDLRKRSVPTGQDPA